MIGWNRCWHHGPPLATHSKPRHTPAQARDTVYDHCAHRNPPGTPSCQHRPSGPSGGNHRGTLPLKPQADRAYSANAD